MVNRVNKIGRYVGAIKEGYHTLMGKDLSKAVNKKAVSAIDSYKKGGKVKRTGKALVHRGEVVLPKKTVTSLNYFTNLFY